MPANLPPQYFHVQNRLQQASSAAEKIAILEELLSIVPKHKGTEKVQMELKSKISRLKKEAQSGGIKGPARFSFHIPKEGVGQAVLCGPTNVGKSSLFTGLTGVGAEIGDFPFTTRDYKIGMMRYENVQVQIVDTPPIMPEFMDKWMPSVIKNADLTVCVIDPSADDILEQVELVNRRLEEKGISLFRRDPGILSPKVLIVANKSDKDSFQHNMDIMREFYPDIKPVIFSAETKEQLPALKQAIYRALDVVRIYCKPQGKSPDFNSPVVLKNGSNIMDFAADLGKVFVEKFRHARLIRPDNPQGIMVPRDYKLNDGDIIELCVNE